MWTAGRHVSWSGILSFSATDRGLGWRRQQRGFRSLLSRYGLLSGTGTQRPTLQYVDNKGEQNEKYCATSRGKCRTFGLRDNAPGTGHADLSGRLSDPGHGSLPAASPASAAARGLPGRNDGPRRRILSGSAAAAADDAAAGAPLGRARLNSHGWRWLRQTRSCGRLVASSLRNGPLACCPV